jgi:hypothetical protein
VSTNFRRLLVVMAIAAFTLPAPIHATDVDGPNDCQRALQDFGDAPEGIYAYPGVIGHFPTCLFPGAPGTVEAFCPTGLPPPGATGYVRHLTPTGTIGYWLGCGIPGAGPSGIDSETNGKVNDTGGPVSACGDISVDCTESAFGMTFGQDECYGSTDAGLATQVVFTTCTASTFTFSTYSCGTQPHQAYLNILVDWNQDGDWNDNFGCPGTPNGCVSEWAVANVPIDILPGCQSHLSPAITAGPNVGFGWMRVTISDTPVPPDFPWAGSVNVANSYLLNGETEDYPVLIHGPNTGCLPYEDWGDAPEGIAAYATGIVGHFPTCSAATPPGSLDLPCGTPSGSPPGPTGYVRHIAAATDTVKYWLGCGTAADPSLGVDSETDGKVSVGSVVSACDPHITVDCVEPAFGLSFGQDECYGDADAALVSPVAFYACSLTTFDYRTYNCAALEKPAFLNVLVDWNHDGDWNDNAYCLHSNRCVPEWAVRNKPILLPPGCATLTTPFILGGDDPGDCWMRLTISEQPANADFPWAGTATMPNLSFSRGETEDYPVKLLPSTVGVDPRLPDRLWLAPVTPSPARTATQLVFGLPTTSRLSLVAYDVSGRAVRHFLDGTVSAGEQHVTWDFRDDRGAALPAGLYLVRLEVNGVVLSGRVIHIE